MTQIGFGIGGPRGNFGINLDLAGASGWPTTINYSTQFYGGGFGVPYGCNGYQASLGVYYPVGAGLNTDGGGYSYSRIPGIGGPFGWAQTPAMGVPMGAPNGMDPIQHGAAGIGHLVGQWGGGDPTDPGYVRKVIYEAGEAQRRYDEVQDKRMKEAERKDRSEAPTRLTDRAEKYFDGLVKNEKQDGSQIFNAASQRRIAEDERKEARGDRNIEHREDNLISLVKDVKEWLRGDNSDVNRGKFTERVAKWREGGKELTTRQMLLALVSPGADKPSEVGQAEARKLMAELGIRGGGLSTASDYFLAYEQMLKDRFGDDYDAVIKRIFNRTESFVSGEKKAEGYKKVTVEDLTAKDYSEAQAKTIMEKIFKDRSGVDQRDWLKDDFPSVSDKENAVTTAYKVSKWYLRAVKGWKDADKIEKKVKELGGQKDIKWDLGKLLDKLGAVDEAKSDGGEAKAKVAKAGKKGRHGPVVRPGAGPAKPVDKKTEDMGIKKQLHDLVSERQKIEKEYKCKVTIVKGEGSDRKVTVRANDEAKINVLEERLRQLKAKYSIIKEITLIGKGNKKTIN